MNLYSSRKEIKNFSRDIFFKVLEILYFLHFYYTPVNLQVNPVRSKLSVGNCRNKSFGLLTGSIPKKTFTLQRALFILFSLLEFI
jgi:hypothetical protein